MNPIEQDKSEAIRELSDAGMPCTAIAGELGISAKTVKRYRRAQAASKSGSKTGIAGGWRKPSELIAWRRACYEAAAEQRAQARQVRNWKGFGHVRRAHEMVAEAIIQCLTKAPWAIAGPTRAKIEEYLPAELRGRKGGLNQ